MTAKEYLKQYEYAQKRADRLREEYETELLKVDAVRSLSDNDGMPHGSNISKPTENKAIRLADKALKWKAAELDAIEIRQEVFDVIYDIPGDEGELLYNRYIKLMFWKDIAEVMKYTERGIYKIHGRALRLVEQKCSL